MSNSTGTWLILLFVLVAFPVFFTILWVGITLLMSFIGGWGKVAKRYPAIERPQDGAVVGRVTGMFGVARYKFVLTVITTDTGLYIENRKVFRPGHHPLFIPFSAIHNARKQTLFFWEYVGFDVDDLASVRLPSKVFEGTPVEIMR
jgi:hypothetical protein